MWVESVHFFRLGHWLKKFLPIRDYAAVTALTNRNMNYRDASTFIGDISLEHGSCLGENNVVDQKHFCLNWATCSASLEGTLIISYRFMVVHEKSIYWLRVAPRGENIFIRPRLPICGLQHRFAYLRPFTKFFAILTLYIIYVMWLPTLNNIAQRKRRYQSFIISW